MSSAHRKEGWLKKNHAGREFASKNVRRWFTTTGFQVVYYSDSDKQSAKGHFDLRNVMSIEPSHSTNAGEGAVDLSIGEKGKTSKKLMTISFLGDWDRERDGWLKLWCSAILLAHVHDSLKPFADARLANELNAEFAAQKAMSRKSRVSEYLMSSAAPKTTQILTPRMGTLAEMPEPPPTAVASAPATAAPAPPSSTTAASAAEPSAPKTVVAVPKIPDEELDTPRETPPPSRPAEAVDTAVEEPAAGAVPPAGAQPPTEPATSTATEETFEITVPDGVTPGSRLQATTPSGVRVKLVVPAGAKPGMLLTFQVPRGAKRSRRAQKELEEQLNVQAVKIQAAVRGRRTRNLVHARVPSMPPPGKARVPPGVPPSRRQIEEATGTVALEQAATRLQSTFRGHTTRNEQQESSRMQWLEYYLQPEVREFEKAETLAVTAEELARVRAAQLAAVDGDDPQEIRRVQWLKHYMKGKEFARAMELAISELELAAVLKGRVLASKVLFACVPRASELELERSIKFVDAVRRCEWALAETLAISGDEFQDVADSRARVAALKQALRTGKFELAQTYAITQAEVDEIFAAAEEMSRSVADIEPEAAIAVLKVQAVHRGKAVRGRLEAVKVERAAVKVQAIARGHISRDVRQEERRQEWLQFYAAEKDFTKALDLAVSQREVDAIHALQSQAATHVELADTWCRCFAPPPPSRPRPDEDDEDEERTHSERPFAVAIREYNWSAAEELAADREDEMDLHDSRWRVEAMHKFTRTGQFNRAAEMAITQKEFDQIRNAHTKAALATAS